ncbi:MAG: invasion associated locus B family protein [Hyphomicrobium sp.]
MNYRNQTNVRVAGRTMQLGLTLASGLLALGLAATAATAQTKTAPKAAPAAPAAAPAAAAPAQPQTFWVKLCEKAKVPIPAKDGKITTEDKNICLTHHERLDGNSGMVIVSAALRNVEGSDKQHLMVMVPLAIGVAIPPGLRAAVYDKDTWAKAQKNEKIDDKALKPVDLKYTLCHPTGCTAEIEATKELVDQLKAGGGLVVLAMNGSAQPVPFSIPLDGFAVANAGAPVDNTVYSTERTKFFRELRARQEDAYQKAVEAQKTQERLAPKPGELAPAPLQPKKP